MWTIKYWKRIQVLIKRWSEGAALCRVSWGKPGQDAVSPRHADARPGRHWRHHHSVCHASRKHSWEVLIASSLPPSHRRLAKPSSGAENRRRQDVFRRCHLLHASWSDASFLKVKSWDGTESCPVRDAGHVCREYRRRGLSVGRGGWKKRFYSRYKER